MPAPIIEQYRFKRIVVYGRVWAQDLIIGPDGVVPNWRRVSGHSVAWQDLDTVLGLLPEVLVLGTGRFGLVRVPTEIVRRLVGMNIRLIAEPTARACKMYNELCQEQRVVAVLHLAC